MDLSKHLIERQVKQVIKKNFKRHIINFGNVVNFENVAIQKAFLKLTLNLKMAHCQLWKCCYPERVIVLNVN